MSNNEEVLTALLNMTQSLANEVASLRAEMQQREMEHQKEMLELRASIAISRHPEMADQNIINYITNKEQEAISSVGVSSKFNDELNVNGIFRNR